MNETILVGVGREIRRMPADPFAESMKGLPAKMASRLAFMTRDHHLVRDFVVREMPRQEGPISPPEIANVTGFDLGKVSTILADLEQNLFFLVRDGDGNVSWAFPVTTSITAHRLTFSTGEHIFGACAEDAFAAPFVRGRLRRQKVQVSIASKCHHCSRSLSIEVDDELRWRIQSPGARPLLFEPDIQWDTFQGQNIIHDY